MSSVLTQQLSLLTTDLNLSFGIIIVVFGVLGGLFNLIIFSHKNFRKTSCGIYFFSASFFSIALILTGQLPRLIITSTNSPLLTTLWYCKIRIYLTNSFGLMARICLVLATFDRLLLCSLNARTRTICNPKIAIRILLIFLFISFLLPIHVLISNELRLPSRACYSDLFWLQLYDLSYQFIFIGILPSILMNCFSLQLIYRLKSQRIRFARELNRRDKEFIWMTLGQIFCYTIIHLIFLVNITYNRVSLYEIKTRDRLAIESFLSFLINVEFIYFYFAFTFILNLIFSSHFRKHFQFLCNTNRTNNIFNGTVTRIMPLNMNT